VPQRHLGSIEMEEIHQLDRLAFSQRGKIDPLRLVIKLDLDRVDLDVFWEMNVV
jgi:hypothetical protein